MCRSGGIEADGGNNSVTIGASIADPIRGMLMSAQPDDHLDHEDLIRRIRRDMVDSWDEELEMDIEDYHPLPDLPDGGASDPYEKDYRKKYFQQLFRLQGELVKLQDWVAATRQKVVILFEGRDAAGKGGAIKRITQKLNPASAAWWRCRHPTTANARSGTSSVTCRTCPRRARSCCSIAAGTTVPVSNT
jgi:hypothetical protein